MFVTLTVANLLFWFQNFPLVTLYANLGDDAIVHGINQVPEVEVTMFELSFFNPSAALH